MNIILGIVIYLIGFFLTLGYMDNKNPPIPPNVGTTNCHDTYETNIIAAIFWPFFWIGSPLYFFGHKRGKKL